MTISLALGAPVMMQLGDYQFGLSTAAYQQLTRSDDWRWPAQDRIGRDPALQFVGPGASTITLDGVIYPEWRGGAGQLDAMRAEAKRGRPLVLVCGLGRAHGMWVIERIDETQTVFAGGGVPRKQEFRMQIKRASEALTQPAPVIPPLPRPTPLAAPESAPVAAKTRALADGIGGRAHALAASASNAWRRLQAAPAGKWVAEAAGAAQRCAEVARGLQNAATRARATLIVGDSAAGRRVAQMLGEHAGAFRTRAESASRVLRRAGRGIEGTSPDAMRAVSDADGAARGLEALCRQIAREVVAITESEK